MTPARALAAVHALLLAASAMSGCGSCGRPAGPDRQAFRDGDVLMQHIGRIERLGDLNWRPHEKLIRSLAGGELPLEREMVTPESVAASPQLEEIRSTF